MSTKRVESTEHNMDTLREELIKRRLAGRRSRVKDAITPVDRSAPLPLSSGQEQLWLSNRMAPDSAEYNAPLVLRLHGDLDVAALRRTVDELAGRHEILRTRYALVEGRPRQIIDPPSPADFAVVPVEAAAGPERDAEAVRAARAAALVPFDLERDVPFRVRVLRFDDEDHVLVMIFHHVAFDAMSHAIVLTELEVGYRSATEGVPSPLEPVPVQYADYAAWQQGRLSAPVLRRHLDHWRERLDGIAPLALPTDRPRPAVRDWRGETLGFAVPAEVAEELRKIAQENDSSLFIVVLTAFQVLLSRYTGMTDIVVGTSVSGRNRPELQRMVGYVSDAIPMRARWDGAPAFGDLLARNREAVLSAFDHQEMPFARLVDELVPERDLSMTPIFQVMFDMQGAPPHAFDLAGLRAEPLDVASGIAKFDLTMLVAEEPDGSLSGHLEYATALFARSTAERVCDHYTRLLAAVAADPATETSRLRFIGPEELAVVLAEPLPGAIGGTRTHELFERRAAETPEATAVIAGEERVSYGDLDARANRFAHHLRALGAAPESRVGVLLDRGPDLVACLLGIWKAGAAYVPLDPAYPPDRLRFILDDAGAELVVTDSAQAGSLGGFPADRMILLDHDPAGERPSSPVEPRGDLDGLAYVIYTSGSTGRPKGVLVSHRGLANYLGWTVETYASAGQGGAPLFSSIAFDLGIPDLYTPLITGQPVHLLPQDVDVADLGPLLAAGAPYGFVKLTPGHLDLLTQQLTADQVAGLAGLVIAAGDAFTGRLANRWREMAGPGGTRLAAEYGPTEITIGNSAFFVDDDEAAQLVSIGRPIPNTTMYVLDDLLEPVPIGVVGEVCIGGVGLARGYAGRPDLTAEKFVPDPYGPPGSRLYRSGDLGRMSRDGNIEFVARVDHQVKIRGYRIELGEIEAALTADPRVRDAVVVAVDGRLIAYVAAEAGRTANAAELRETLSASLPPHMVPAVIAFLDEIPLTANGKVDRKALPAPDREARPEGREYVGPRTPVEERVAGIWHGVLGLERVGVRDDFFEDGGDSLRAVALVGALRQAGLDASVRDVFEARTVERLCEMITGRPAPADAERRVQPYELLDEADRAALNGDFTDAYPMSLIQTGMILEMLDGDGENRYLNHTSFRVRDDRPFSPRHFQEAVNLIVARHEAMRTSFDLTSVSVPIQRVHAVAELPVHTHDVRDMDVQDQGRTLREHARRERVTPFDLERPPMMRMTVHVFDDTSWWLSVTECHAILEGWSYHSQLMEMLGAYRSLRDGAEPEPARAETVRYADFIAAEQAALRSEEDRAYWRRIVTDYPKFTMSAALADPPGSPRERYERFISFEDLEKGLRAAAATANVPLKALLHAAHLEVLSRHGDGRRFFGGMVCDARPEVLGADRVSGMYLNTVPFAFDGRARTWRTLAQEVFAREIELWPHRRLPNPAIQREFGGRLIDVLFHYLDFYQVDTELVDFEASIDESPNEFPMCVGAMGNRLLLSTHTHLLSRAAGTRFLEMVRAVLEDMVRDIDGEARAVFPSLEEYGPVSSGGAAVRLVPELLAERVAATPGETALVAGDERLSFAELDERAGRIAYRLRELGVGPETTVGVLLDRGPDLVATLLGVWKAGGAYVPLDPSHPAGRIAFTLTDARVRAVVSASAHAGLLDGYVGPVVPLDRTDLAGLPVFTQERETDPDGLAYVTYTSGSTGRPKGVLAHHRGLANYLSWVTENYASAGDGGTALFGSVAFDLSVPLLFATLLAGRPLHLMPPNACLADLGRLLSESGPFGFLMATPGQLSALSAQLPPERFAELAGLVVSAGDALPAALAGRVRAHLPLASEYGPAEVTVGTAACFVREPLTTPLAPLGAPIPNTAMYVLDDDLRRVPPGVTGEVCVGGIGVTRGYAGSPDLTAERFVPDPYGAPGTRLYRTGDLGRVGPDGTVEFVGRADEQVKILGHRVEPGEIEAVLTADPRIAEAAVVAEGEGPLDQRLVAYVVPAGEHTPDPAELRELLSGTLPSYLIPSGFVTVDRMPLTANGKLDRGALPAPDRAAMPGRRPYVAPRTDDERLLAGIWSSMLRVEKVGADDDFLGLGGDSLALLRMIATARRAGLPLSLWMVHRDGTLAELATAARRGVRPVRPERVREELAERHVPGLSLALIKNGVLAETAEYGVLSAGGDRPVTADSAFGIASITKHVTALAVVRLAADGRLDLDAVDTVTGETVRGLFGDRFADLRRVVSEVTGEKFTDVVSKLVLEPLGMAGSGFGPPAAERRAEPHDESGRPLTADPASPYLWTTAADLAQVALEVQRAYHGQDARILDRPMVDTLLAGLGTHTEDGSDIGFGHFGQADGYAGATLSRLLTRDGVIVLTNGAGGAALVRYLLDRLL